LTNGGSTPFLFDSLFQKKRWFFFRMYYKIRMNLLLEWNEEVGSSGKIRKFI